jgi:GNAT superfamily N-acetyltransferase
VADVSVRPARPPDVPEIARVQVETWRAGYAHLLPPDVLAAATEDRALAEWTAAVAEPPSPRHRVLVAQEQQRVVGFAAFGPADADADPAPEPGPTAGPTAEPGAGTGQIHTLLVEPRWGRRGHGSRLLAAIVDHLRADGAVRAVVWVLDGDVASSRFYASAGWEPDGYVRTLQDGGRTLRESRLHVSLGESEGNET